MAYKDSFNVEYSNDIKTLIKAPKDLEGEYTINSGVTTIGREAFKGCVKLTAIHLPSTFSKLEYSAFTGCKSLKAIYYNGDLASWLELEWNSCFDTGYSLYLKNELVSEISIPLSITTIKHDAFFRCDSLKKVTFHSEVAEIESNAFNKSGLSGLLVIAEGVKIIGKLAFFGCQNLTSIKLPSTLNELWFGALSCCYNLRNITISADNPKFKTSLGILYDIEGSLKAIAPCATDEPLHFPETVKKIVADTFCYSAVPKGGIVLTKNIKEVVKDGFLKVSGLTVYIPVGTASYFKKLGVPMDDFHEIFNQETAFLLGHNGITAIINNPFRILGVFSNAPQKEITANARKIKRFIEVGKTVEFPSDLNFILPPLNRTSEMVDNALAALTNAQDKFKYSLFWFVKGDDIDGIALDNLQANNLAKAKEIFEKRETWSSSLNLSTLAFVENRYEDAVATLTESIHGEYFYEDLATSVCGEEFEIDEDTASKLLVDSILEDVSIPECRALFKEHGTSQSDDNYLDELLSAKYSKIINDAISTAKSVFKGDAEGSLDAAKRLRDTTQSPLEEYAQFVGEDSAEYAMLADRLANQILQSSIDYYNNSIDRYAVFEALDLTKYALSIAKGQVKKDRCQQNLDILKKIAAKVPPREVGDDDNFLSNLIVKHRSDSGTIENAWSVLDLAAPSIVHIKECLKKLEDDSEAHEQMENYLKMVSTAIVNLSLTKLIDAVNNARDGDCSLIRSAWDLMLNMDKFPMQEDFKKERYTENRDTLKSIRSHISTFSLLGYSTSSVPTTPSRIVDLRTDDEVWESCRTIKDCEYYLKRFPKGSHIRAAKNLIEKLKIEAEDALWKKSQDNEDYTEYISQYPNGRYIEEARIEQQIVEGKRDDAAFDSCKTITNYSTYLQNYPSGRHHIEAKRKRDQLIEEDNRAWALCKSQADCENYLKNHSDGLHIQDAKDLMAEIKKQASILWWIIAAEIIVTALLIMHIFVSPEAFKGTAALVSVVSMIIGVFIATVKYFYSHC